MAIPQPIADKITAIPCHVNIFVQPDVRLASKAPEAIEPRKVRDILCRKLLPMQDIRFWKGKKHRRNINQICS